MKIKEIWDKVSFVKFIASTKKSAIKVDKLKEKMDKYKSLSDIISMGVTLIIQIKDIDPELITSNANTIKDGRHFVDVGKGDDVVYGSTYKDEIIGGEGDDNLIAMGGNDTIDAGEGDNRIEAGSGDDIVTAGSGDDLINTYDGNDTVRAEMVKTQS